MKKNKKLNNKINLKSRLNSIISTAIITTTTAVSSDEVTKEIPSEDNNDENDRKPKKKKITLKKTDLGEIKREQNSKPINHVIKDIILVQNPELKSKNFQVVNIKKTTATIIFENDSSNQIDIIFNIIANDKKPDSKFITNINTDLNEIRVFDEVAPNEVMFKTAILKKILNLILKTIKLLILLLPMLLLKIKTLSKYLPLLLVSHVILKTLSLNMINQLKVNYKQEWQNIILVLLILLVEKHQVNLL